MKKKRKKQAADGLPPITPDMKVADLLKAYPESLDALIKIGFEPLRSVVARNTIAKLFTLEQAAGFRGVKFEEMLAAIKKAAGIEVLEDEAAPAGETAVSYQDGVPELKGDITFLGLVPCPIRNVLIDRFDAFVQKFTASTGNTIAWWMAGEGAGTRDIRPWLSRLVGERDFDSIPDIFMAVGTEIFLHKQYGKLLYDECVFGPFSVARKPRPDLKNLEDPNGILALEFAVMFTFSCRPENLPDGLLPKTWADLAKSEFKGHVALPSTDLPVIPDLLSALYHYLGEEQFESLASNMGSSMHPAQASPRAGIQEVPGVVILPEHFSKMSITTGAVHIMPEDGPVAVPAYLAMKHDAGKEAIAIAEFLSSKEFLEPFWKLGSFIPNREDIPTDEQYKKIITRPWEAILNDDPNAETDRLIEMVKKGDTL